MRTQFTIKNEEKFQNDHASVLASIMENLAKNDDQIYQILQSVVDLSMSYDYLQQYKLKMEFNDYHKQRQLIESLQITATKTILKLI